MKVIINAVIFKLHWVACVVGGSLWGVAGALGMIAFSWRVGTLQRDAWIAFLLAPAGWFLDTTWITLGILDYGAYSTAPLWIVLLWVGLAFALCHAMSMFVDRPWLGGLLTLFAAPGTYLAGQSLGAVSVPDVWMLGVISIAWGSLFYAVFTLLGQNGVNSDHVAQSGGVSETQPT